MRFPVFEARWPVSPLAPADAVQDLPPSSDSAWYSEISRAHKALYGKDLPKKQHINRSAGSEENRLKGCVLARALYLCDWFTELAAGMSGTMLNTLVL
jgi:hypothetical protein